MRVCRVSPCDTTQDEALLGGSVPVIEGDPVGHVLDGVPIEVDLELVHAFRVKPGVGISPKIEWQTLITKTVPTSPRKR